MLSEYENYRESWKLKQQALLKAGTDKKYYVYLHVDENTNDPHYVGIGHTINRPWDYSRRSSLHKKSGVRTWIIADGISKDASEFWEIRWIKALKEAGYPLVNILKGGEGFDTDWSMIPPEVRSERARKAHAAASPEVRSERSRKAANALTAEQRSAIGRVGNSKLSRLQRSENAKKGASAAVKNGLSAMAKESWASLSHDEKLAKSRKGWEASRLRSLRAKQYWGA